MGPLRNSDGSAEWQSGQAPNAIKIICSVNGPLEPRLRDELPQQASIELVYRRHIGLPMTRERLIQDKFHTCLLSMLRRDLLPRTLIQVVVQLLEGDCALEAELSEGVNVITMALIDAGVPMSGMVAAVSYGYTKDGQLVRLAGDQKLKTDPLESLHAVAYKFVGDETPQLVMSESTGQFSKEQLFEVLNQAQHDAADVIARMKQNPTRRK